MKRFTALGVAALGRPHAALITSRVHWAAWHQAEVTRIYKPDICLSRLLKPALDAVDGGLRDTRFFHNQRLGEASIEQPDQLLLRSEGIHNPNANTQTHNHQYANELSVSHAFTHNHAMELRHALAAWIDHSKHTQNSLADIAHVPQPTIQRILSGATASPKTDTVEKIAKALGLTYGELMAGPPGVRAAETPDPMRQAKERLEAMLKGVPREPLDVKHEEETGKTKYVGVPIYSAKAACGLGYMNDHVEIEGTFAMPRHVLERHNVSEANAAIIHAEGDSMSTYICDGDLVLIDRGTRKIANGQVYAFMMEDEVVIKRVSKGFGLITLTSDNPNKAIFPDRTVPPGAEAMVLGKVIWRGG